MVSARSRASVSAWRPPVPGIAEVFHAHFTDHAYPAHTHDTWDLMILDDGSVDFALDRRHGATGTAAVLLLRRRIHQLHAALVHAGDGFEAESVSRSSGNGSTCTSTRSSPAHPTHLIRCFKQTFGLPPTLT